jgi:Flp pilus assembly CpaE family ATPase
MAARRVLLLTNELATASAVTAGLGDGGAAGRMSPEDICRDVRELGERLAFTNAPAALVDIDGAGTLATLEPIVRRFPDTRFVVLSGTMDSQRLLDAMQLGARHYMVKDTITAELAGVLNRICPSVANGQSGAVFTVLSSGGGCGATTLAVNLANELQLALSSGTPSASSAAAGGRALVVDLDTCYGAVGTYLGVDGEYGILDLLDRSGALDSHLIETTSVAYADRLHVLVSTASSNLGEPARMSPARLGAAAAACRGAYAVTVIDAPRVGLEAAAELVRASDVTLLPLQLTIKDIRSARQMLARLAPGGVSSLPGGKGSVVPIVTRYAKRTAMVTLAEARQALGNIELATLCNDYHAAGQSLSHGKPLAQVSARSDIRKEILQIAGWLLAAHATPAAAAARNAGDYATPSSVQPKQQFMMPALAGGKR